MSEVGGTCVDVWMRVGVAEREWGGDLYLNLFRNKLTNNDPPGCSLMNLSMASIASPGCPSL